QFVVVVAVFRQSCEVAPPNPAEGIGDALPPGFGVMARGCVHLTIDIVRLPPVVPVHKQALFRHGWPAHNRQVRPRQRPDGRRMAIMNGRLSEVSAMRPFFFHGGSITPQVDIQYKFYITMHAINLRAGESKYAWQYPPLRLR